MLSGLTSLLTPQRVVQDELLDEHDAPQRDMERSLRDLRRINRYLGGLRIYKTLLRRISPDGRSRITVLDLGCGSCDLLDAAARSRAILGIGVDFKIDHLLYRPQRSAMYRVVADARTLPFRDTSVDVVTSAHFFHHFEPDENKQILLDSLRVARIGVAVNDTRRHRAPLFFVRLLGWLGLVGRITRFDAPASVLRAYTVAEAEAVVPAGVHRAVVMRMFPFRFALVLWK